MPTGYTHGILDGKIKTFHDFAKVCMKAFGACVHMRDDDNDKPYVPQTPSDYHPKAIKEAQTELKKAQQLSDAQIVSNKVKSLTKDISYYENQIVKADADRMKLKTMLSDVKHWRPPTEDHDGIKAFMLEQLNSTLEFDGRTNWQEEKLIELRKELQSIDASKIRQAMIDSAIHDIEYHTKEYEIEVKRCNDANKWVTDLLKSL